MRNIIVLLLICQVSVAFSQNDEKEVTWEPELTEQWTPTPPVVYPGKLPGEEPMSPPSNAIVLFDGTDLSEWLSYPNRSKFRDSDGKIKYTNSGEPAKWNIVDGALVVNKGQGDIRTKRLFRDFHLHLEWKVPEDITGQGQRRGNSGVFLQGIYEIQVLDNYENKTYVNGQAASVYKQTPPMVNAMRPPGEWNIYDIIYTAPTYRKDGSYRTKPMVTVFHNGVLVHYNTRIQGTTAYTGLPRTINHGKGPIGLQDHNDPSEPISFRNIWVREL